jgi:hypothetical protein
VAWKNEFNTFTIPRMKGECFDLSRWADQERVSYRAEKSKVKKLNDIGFPWKLDSYYHNRRTERKSWNSRFNELKEYYTKYGHSKVPLNWEPNTALSHWVVNMRRKRPLMLNGRRQTMLTEKRVRQLNGLDFLWRPTPVEYKWSERFHHLKVFRAKYGHCNVPPDYFLDANLCFWVRSQRWLKAEGGLSKEKVEKLGLCWEEDASFKNHVESVVSKHKVKS